MTGRPAAVVVAAVALATLVSGCTDDGASVRNLDPSASDGSGSGSGTGSGTDGSGSGLSSQDLSATTDDALVLDALDGYEAYVADQTDLMITRTSVLTDAVRAGDLAAAQAAYAPSREPWERIEPIAALIEDVDVAVDARVDDFASPDDPAFTGWHRLEYLLFDQQTTDGGAAVADALDADLAALRDGLGDLEIPAAAVPVGASELIEEVSLGKITGEENRYSKTDLWDINANLEGSRAAIDLLRPAIEAADAGLMLDLDASFDATRATLDPLRDGDGWALYCLEDDAFPSSRCPDVTVDAATVTRLQAQLAALSEETSQVAGVLGLA